MGRGTVTADCLALVLADGVRILKSRPDRAGHMGDAGHVGQV